MENDTGSKSIRILDFLKRYKDAFTVIFVVIGAIWYLYNHIFTIEKINDLNHISDAIAEINTKIQDPNSINIYHYGLSDAQLKALIEAIMSEQNTQRLTIIEYNEIIEKQSKIIKELLNSKDISEDVKILIKEGDFSGAETLVDEQFENKGNIGNKELALKLYERGYVKYMNLNNLDAFELLEEASSLQPNNPIYANGAGVIAKNIGHYNTAIEYFNLALAITNNIYGDDYPSIATYYYNLGLAWFSKNKNRYKRAIYNNGLALASGLRAYDERFPSLVIYYHYQGPTERSKKNYEKAIKYFRLALASEIKYFGENHPSVADTQNYIGLAYFSIGKYNKAIEYYKQALGSSPKYNGNDQPTVASYLNNLGLAWYAKSKYGEAISNYENALDLALKIYDEDHPIVAIYRTNLGLALHSTGHYDAAKSLYKLALSSSLENYNNDHLSILVIYNNLGLIWYAKDQYDKAISFYEKALAGISEKFTVDYRTIKAITYNNLSLAYVAKGDYDEAINKLNKTFYSTYNNYARPYISERTFFNNLLLARQLKDDNKWLYSRCEDRLVYWKNNGKYILSNHIASYVCLNNIGLEMIKREYEYLPVDFIEEAVEKFKSVLGVNHPNTQIVLRNLSMVKKMIKNK